MTDKVYVATEKDCEEIETWVMGVFSSREKADEIIDKEKEEIFNDPMHQPWECCESPDKDCVEGKFEFQITVHEVNK